MRSLGGRVGLSMGMGMSLQCSDAPGVFLVSCSCQALQVSVRMACMSPD